MSGFVPMPGAYYTVCFALVILAWVFFTLAFTVFRPRTPGAGAAANAPPAASAPPAGARDAKPAAEARPARDRRSLWGVLLQALGYAIMWTAPRPPFPALSKFPGPFALVVAAAAVALAWIGAWFAYWAQRVLGKEWSYTARLIAGHRLVTAGPYALVRHPIYTSMLILWVATALAVARPWNFALGIVPMIAGSLMRVRIEDRLLRESFGAQFDDWKQKTPAMIPGLV